MPNSSPSLKQSTQYAHVKQYFLQKNFKELFLKTKGEMQATRIHTTCTSCTLSLSFSKYQGHDVKIHAHYVLTTSLHTVHAPVKHTCYNNVFFLLACVQRQMPPPPLPHANTCLPTMNCKPSCIQYITGNELTRFEVQLNTTDIGVNLLFIIFQYYYRELRFEKTVQIKPNFARVD